MDLGFQGQNFASEQPLIGSFFDDSEQKALEQLQKQQDAFNALQGPQFQNYDPEKMKWLQDYHPELAQYQLNYEDPSLKSSQMSALNKLAGFSDTGMSDQDALGYHNAIDLGNQMAKSQTDAALQNAQARGIAGSGQELAMREMASQGGAQRAQQAALQQAADSSRQRALYNQAYSQQLGGMRDQDFKAQSANTGIINQFNQANTNAQNQAQVYNIGGRQNTANQNVANSNQAQQYNNTLKQQAYDDAYKKAAGLSGAYGNMANGYSAVNADRTAERNANTQLPIQVMQTMGDNAKSMGSMAAMA